MPLSNKEIAKAFKVAGQLLELHDENQFKVRSMQNAAFKIERLPSPLETLSAEEIATIEGIGKTLQAKIGELLEKQTFKELEELRQRTPAGLLDILSIKGVGPKKARVLWKDLGVETVGELLYACNENRLVELKGFGSKTQEQIRHAIEYAQSNAGKFLYASADLVAQQLLTDINQANVVSEISLCGAMRRKCEIVESLDFVAVEKKENALSEFLNSHPLIDAAELRATASGLEGMIAGKIPFNIFLTTESDFAGELFMLTGSEKHLDLLKEKYAFTDVGEIKSEKEIYQSLKLPYFEPELREGLREFEMIRDGRLPELVEMKDLKGILHNHTTYSDGAHTLEQMAKYCKELGYEYLGVCDHSQTAFYANGLSPERILKQHEEIEKLNKTLSPFRILKGIESDILSDGSLDYPDDILKSFDIVVASVHSVLKMDIEKATRRLIKAIENPYTDILGHPTGRLLLAREGYPLDHRAIIDACAANGVVLEVNANPYRLDLDWRWIPYALEKGVMISINPDAHRMEGYADMYYGVCAARKGGLTKENTFNALPLDKLLKELGG